MREVTLKESLLSPRESPMSSSPPDNICNRVRQSCQQWIAERTAQQEATVILHRDKLVDFCKQEILNKQQASSSTTPDGPGDNSSAATKKVEWDEEVRNGTSHLILFNTSRYRNSPPPAHLLSHICIAFTYLFK